MRAWWWALFASTSFGLLGAFFLREHFPDFILTAAFLVGYSSTIVSIGTSNVFQGDKNRHFTPTTQRATACVAAFAFAAGLVAFFTPGG